MNVDIEASKAGLIKGTRGFVLRPPVLNMNDIFLSWLVYSHNTLPIVQSKELHYPEPSVYYNIVHEPIALQATIRTRARNRLIRTRLLLLQHAPPGSLIPLPRPEPLPLKIHPISPHPHLPNLPAGLLIELELLAANRRHMQEIHLIHLLQRLPTTLNQKEENHKERRKVTARKDISISVLDISSDEGRKEREHEIPEPICGRRERHPHRSVAIREYLRNASPDQRAPGGSEAHDEEAREHDHDGARRLRGRGAGGGVFELELADRGEDEEAHELPEGGDVEGFPTPEVPRHPDAHDGGADVDTAEDHGGYVGVVEADALEDGGAVVEEVVLRKLVLYKGKYVEKKK